jgi:hypothetical protein
MYSDGDYLEMVGALTQIIVSYIDSFVSHVGVEPH